MTRALRLGLLGLALGSLGAGLILTRDGKRDARASDPGAPIAAPIARLMFAHGEVDGFVTEVAIATVDASKNLAAVRPLATVNHSKGSAIRGAALGDVAFVVASEEAPRGTSYDGALYRIESGRVTRLCGSVFRASTPIVTKSGRVFVARGVDGQDPPAAEAQKLVLRTDQLTIDDVDPITGATRTVWKGTGYQAFLGAVTSRDELVVYHSTPSGASLFTLDPTTLATRAAAVAPFARDFSFDKVHGAVVFANMSPDGRHQVVSLDLASMSQKTLYNAAHDHPMPFALPSGDVALSSDGDKGLAVLQAGQHRLLSPLGDGDDQATHTDGRWVAVRHQPKVSNDPPMIVAWDPLSNKTQKLDVPSAHFVEPLGFVAGGAL